MNRNSDKFFNHVESIAGPNGEYFPIGADPTIVIASFNDVPEQGCLTAFSFGLSAAGCAAWKYSRPELVISLDSNDNAWALAMGEVIQRGWGKSLFSYGQILNFGEPISDESEMSAFLVFSCTVLEPQDVSIQLEDWLVSFSQLYPIHIEEIPIIQKVGAEVFFNNFEIDFFDPKRKPFVLS